MARTDDDLRRCELAESWADFHDRKNVMGVTFAGVQLIRYLADLSGLSTKLLDTLALELMETALIDQKDG